MLSRHLKMILVHSWVSFSLSFHSLTLLLSPFRPLKSLHPLNDLHPQLSGSGRQPTCHLTCLIACKLLAVNPLIRNCVARPSTKGREREKSVKKRKGGLASKNSQHLLLKAQRHAEIPLQGL